MSFGRLGAGFGKQGAPAGAANPAAGMPAAPSGYRWDFVTFDDQRVTFNGQPVVALAAQGG